MCACACVCVRVRVCVCVCVCVFLAVMAFGHSATSYDHIFKIILIGDNGVGKSSFIRRFCEDTYVADMETTIGVDFYLSEIDIDGKKIKVRTSQRASY